MALQRQRLVTLVFDDMETVRMVSLRILPLLLQGALTKVRQASAQLRCLYLPLLHMKAIRLMLSRQ